MAEIYEFMDSLTGRIDMNAWRHDICARMQSEHEGPDRVTTTRDMCMVYFGYVDTEKFFFMGDQMQVVRRMLMDRPIPMILENSRGGWYVVNPRDVGGARNFVTRFSKRFIRAGRRLRRYSEVARETYQLPEGDPLVRAIEGTQPTLDQVDRAMALPSGEENREQERSQDGSDD